MIAFLNNLPAFFLFILIALLVFIFSFGAVISLRRVRMLQPNPQEDAILGNVGTLIGTIYGVLTGLTALFLVNNINYTGDAVQREANAVADIYRDTRWLQEPQRSAIQDYIQTYIAKVMGVEWKLMRDDKPITNHADMIVDEITTALVSYKAKTNAESLLIHDMLDEVRILYDARQQRIHMSRAKLSPEIWFVIFIGTILTLAINFLFKMKFHLHLIVVSATALMVSAMIFLLISLERPFQGNFVIEPVAFEGVLGLIQMHKQQNASQNLNAPLNQIKKVPS